MSSNSGHPVVQGRVVTVVPVVGDTDSSDIRIDSDSILLTRAVGPAGGATSPSRYTSGGDASNGQIGAAGARSLVQVYAHNANAALTRFFMLFNAAALPVNGTAPYWTAALIPNSTDFSLDFPQLLPFATGIWWACSTTRATLTLGAAEMNVSAVFW